LSLSENRRYYNQVLSYWTLSSYHRNYGNCFSLYAMSRLVLILVLNFMQKPTHIRKDGSSVRPRSSLEKAIRELEKMVAECKSKFF
jgi:hypothetical protein